MTKAMENWKLELAVKGQTLAEVKIFLTSFRKRNIDPCYFIAKISLNHFLWK